MRDEQLTALLDQPAEVTEPTLAEQLAAIRAEAEARQAAHTEPSPASAAILRGLNAHGKHVYGGTVDPAVIARRRAKAKAAKAARKANR